MANPLSDPDPQFSWIADVLEHPHRYPSWMYKNALMALELLAAESSRSARKARAKRKARADQLAKIARENKARADRWAKIARENKARPIKPPRKGRLILFPEKNPFFRRQPVMNDGREVIFPKPKPFPKPPRKLFPKPPPRKSSGDGRTVVRKKR